MAGLTQQAMHPSEGEGTELTVTAADFFDFSRHSKALNVLFSLILTVPCSVGSVTNEETGIQRGKWRRLAQDRTVRIVSVSSQCSDCRFACFTPPSLPWSPYSSLTHELMLLPLKKTLCRVG